MEQTLSEQKNEVCSDNVFSFFHTPRLNKSILRHDGDYSEKHIALHNNGNKKQIRNSNHPALEIFDLVFIDNGNFIHAGITAFLGEDMSVAMQR
jgi:hypothetical protein